MSATSTSIFNALSISDSSFFSTPSVFASKSLSIPTRALNLHLSIHKKTQFSSIVARVAEDVSTMTLEQEEEQNYAEPSEEAKVFVANIPFDVDSEKLAELFQTVGQVEIAEIVYNRETDRSRGFGFVTMSTVEEAEKAVEKLNRYEWDGRLLVVNKAAQKGERIERPPRTLAPTSKIFVANMPWDVDDARLEQIFSEHGTVENVRIVLDRETGRSRGFGFVTMSNESEMNNAIAALDGQTIDGRAIKVTVAEQRPRRNMREF